MSRPTRRQFLEHATRLASAWAGTRLLGCAEETVAPPLLLDGWGTPSATESAYLPPAASRPAGMLEVFLLGGLNPWDSFYAVPEHGVPGRGGSYEGQQWWTFQSGPESVPDAFGACGGGPRELLQPYAYAGDGKTVHLGPFVYPLRDRPDLIARMRVIVTAHGQEPHQTAVPLVITGQPQGSPRAAGFASHVGRALGERSPRDAPWSYLVLPDSVTVSALDADVSAASGLHPGAARPLTVRLTRQNALLADLARKPFGSETAAADRLLARALARQTAQLTPPGAAAALASRHLSDYAHALDGLGRTGVLAPLITEDILKPRPGEECGSTRDVDPTAMGIGFGTHLLTRPKDAPAYVQVVDTGLVEGSNGGYDTHEHHVRDSAPSVVHFCKQLAAAVNRPGEGDPNKLDLDRHCIVVSTEMGRTPYPQSGSEQNLGLNHWPYGFVTVIFGGPIDASRAGVVGAIGEDGRATDTVTPAEIRAGLLLAQGIWPFSPEAFAVGHVGGARDELEAAARVLERVLGFKT